MEQGIGINRQGLAKIAAGLIIAVGLLISGFLAGGIVVITETPAQDKALHQGIPVSLVGTIKKVGVSDIYILTVKTEETGKEKVVGLTTRIMTNEKTQFYSTVLNKSGNMSQKKISDRDLRKGDMVTVETMIFSGSVLKILAHRIMVSPDKQTYENAITESPMKDKKVVFGFAGDVIASGFTLTDPDGKTTRIEVDGDTEFVAGGSANSRPSPATYSAVISGAKVSLFGDVLDNGTIRATNIAVAK